MGLRKRSGGLTKRWYIKGKNGGIKWWHEMVAQSGTEYENNKKGGGQRIDVFGKLRKDV